MNRIMKLLQRYAYEYRWKSDAVSHVTAVALATEVQAQQDYTRAVIAERDALKLENERLRAASDAWCAAEQKL